MAFIAVHLSWWVWAEFTDQKGAFKNGKWLSTRSNHGTEVDQALIPIQMNIDPIKTQNMKTNYSGWIPKSKSTQRKLMSCLRIILFSTRTPVVSTEHQGDKIFELHLKFEELSTTFAEVDEVAERILTLGHTPEHTYSAYTELAGIKESPKVSDGMKAVEHILESFKVLIVLQREILDMSSDASDEGTNALMSDYIRAQEKLVWMYSAFLKN